MKYEFRVINLVNGVQEDCSLDDLSLIIGQNCEILRFKEDGFEAIGFVSDQTLVFFAVEFADYALQNYVKKILPEAQTCIDLARKWLEDQSSVSEEQIRTTANDAANAAYAAANAAYCAANDAAAHAAYATIDIGCAGNSATNAVYAAIAARKSKLDERNRQGTFILNFFGVE
jgi:hypothetical protein